MTEIIGGIGLFLLGMILFTDALKALAGDALRSILERFVRGPISGIAWGTGITALIQSSSATTLLTIGFVSAGLLSFTQSLGVILGTNLGTTSTGWIVAAIGLKFSMSQFALPLIGFGAIMRLLGRDRIAAFGGALAGFGLIFVGIEGLKTGMDGLAASIDPASFPRLTWFGVPLLLTIGVLMTVVMQSSSAAVATTLAALHSGAISLDQAAVLVIGQNIGTTVTALLGSIGASNAARRTAIAHTLFNVTTGLVTLAALPLALRLIRWIASHIDGDPGAVSLAAFHTAFNLFGVLVFLPLLDPFSKLVARLVPEPVPSLVRHLDPSVAQVPSVAVEAARRTTMDITVIMIEAIRDRLRDHARRHATQARLATAQEAVSETQRFLGRVSAESGREVVFARHLATIHALDHLNRLASVGIERNRLATIARDPDLQATAQSVLEIIELALPMLVTGAPGGSAGEVPALRNEDVSHRTDQLAAAAATLAKRRREKRAELLQSCAVGQLRSTDAMARIDTYHWLDQIGYHIWRVAVHLRRTPTSNDGADDHAEQAVANS